MTDYQRLQHTLWECKYHVVFIPKYRRKALFTALLGAESRRVGGGAEEGAVPVSPIVRPLSLIDIASVPFPASPSPRTPFVQVVRELSNTSRLSPTGVSG
jgi:putative transposase